MKRISFVIALGLISAFAASSMGAHSVRNGSYRCNRCHVPHAAGRDANGVDIPGAYGVPLWSPAYNSDGLPTFTLYSSAKFDALQTDIGQPDGAAKMCLGCHDGSYGSIGALVNGSHKAAYFGAATGLARSHPVSFTYDSTLASKVPNGGLKDPSADSGLGSSIAKDMLDSRGKMQCTSCHNVHEQGKGELMLKFDWDPAAGNDAILCKSCHNK